MKRLSLVCVMSLAVALGAAPHRPHLDGTWNGSTLTPLQRPAEFRDRATFTAKEAAEFVRTRPERAASRLLSDADRVTQIDLDDTFVETEAMTVDRLRTSLLVDPADGKLPALLPSARARIAARTKRSLDDPETLSLSERCLMGNFGLGGSLASPPMIPSEVIPALYQIVQTDTAVMIFTEWVHDARVVRMNATHLAPSIRKWLGDSVGRFDGDALVVDTTNFRRETHNLDSGERLHVVERLTRVDADTLMYRVTVEDPDTWAAAWTAEWPFHRTAAKLFPAECHEGNYSMENMLRGARAEEKR
ncbi:MAG TPA: hypothetical protein VFA27_15890 [Vicinamibacterales bacterium]|nr:hypothetical protein [Vicinamibacterales bacterium]